MDPTKMLKVLLVAVATVGAVILFLNVISGHEYEVSNNRLKGGSSTPFGMLPLVAIGVPIALWWAIGVLTRKDRKPGKRPPPDGGGTD